MSTDIHIHIEERKDNKWEKVEIPENFLPNDRDYELFGFTEGLRVRTFEPQFEGRGIPKGSCFEDDPNFHNHTYAYLDEIDKAPWTKAGLQFRYFPIFFSHVLPRLMKDSFIFSDEEKRNIRVVMAFYS